MRLDDAQTQYQHYEGTVAADPKDDEKEFEAAAKKAGLDTDRYYPVAFTFYTGEPIAGGPLSPIISVYALDRKQAGTKYEEWRDFAKKQGGVIPVKEFSFEVTVEEFFRWFKRFSIVLRLGPSYRVANEIEIADPVE